jgi:PKD repeat protein
VRFSGSASDPDGEIVSYVWDFGDGESAVGQEVSHTYVAAGEYRPVLTVTDDDGGKASDTCVVYIFEQ